MNKQAGDYDPELHSRTVLFIQTQLTQSGLKTSLDSLGQSFQKWAFDVGYF